MAKDLLDYIRSYPSIRYRLYTMSCNMPELLITTNTTHTHEGKPNLMASPIFGRAIAEPGHGCDCRKFRARNISSASKKSGAKKIRRVKKIQRTSQIWKQHIKLCPPTLKSRTKPYPAHFDYRIFPH